MSIRIEKSDGSQAQPVVGEASVRVADVIDASYAHGIERALALGLDEASVMDALTYCADRRCDETGARCATCRLWSQEQGLLTLDDFCRLFERIDLPASHLAVHGGTGERISRPGTLDDLARTWSGEEYWFLARRTLRRIKYKQHQGAKLRGASHLADRAGAGPVFILVEPQMADNIGMVARAMANFAIEDLRLVNPRDGWPNDKARAAASGAHAIIDGGQSFDSVKSAIADLQWIAATTARPRDLAKPVLTPEQAAREIQARMARGERCGVLFGPERTGLTSDDIAAADVIVMAQVNPTFASINLAQATLLMGYEILKASGLGGVRARSGGEPTAVEGMAVSQPLATKAEVDGLIEHLETELDRAGYYKEPKKRQIMVRNMRTMFERMGASAQEVRTLRGIVAALTRMARTSRDEV